MKQPPAASKKQPRRDQRTPRQPGREPGQIVPVLATAQALLPRDEQHSLVAWFNLYMGLEAGAGSENTFKAKKRDLEAFLAFFQHTTGSEHPDQWTRSVTGAFLRSLERDRKKPTTINRVLATLRHCAAWLHHQRPFLAGNPFDRIADLHLDDPDWKGLSDIEVTRLRSAAEQLVHLKRGKKQVPVRDYALFLVLLQTGLRVSELLGLDLAQYEGKHFTNVKRKGKKVSRAVFLPKEAREALDRYLAEVRERKPGPLFCTKSGANLARQNVDTILKEIADQANARLPESQQIRLSAHILRHTMLRKVAEKHGVQHAMEAAGHTSSQYIWRYVRPTDEQKEKALEDLF